MTTNGKEIGLCQIGLCQIGLRLLAALRHLRSGRVRTGVTIVAQGLCLGLLVASFIPRQAAAADDGTDLSRPLSANGSVAAPSANGTQLMVAHHPKLANFEQAPASRDTRHVANWVVDSGDNRRMPFAIVDKRDAQVFVFDADGRLRGAAPALLGLARGDDSVPGIGDRKLSSIRPEERTTPAGRFVAALGRNARGEDILWIDYDGAVSMHRVIATKDRLKRLATPTPLDNRISYGCINVPTKFYENVVRPAFTGTDGIVYVLPETKLASKVFASYDVEEKHARGHTAGQPVPAQVASGAARNN
jgi:hypothetical protein